MPRIRIRSLGEEIPAREGQSILHAILDAGLELEHACGGVCACSTCHVIVEEGLKCLSQKSYDEEDRLDMAEGVTLKSRLGCQAKVHGDVTITIPPKPY